MRLTPRGPGVDYVTDESLRRGDSVIFSRDSLGNLFVGGQRIEVHGSDERLALRVVHDGDHNSPEVAAIVEQLKRFHVFHDPDLMALRSGGSRTGLDRNLASRSSNVFAILRSWSNQRQYRQRYQFVVDGLKACFPKLCADLDFEVAGQTVTVRLYPPGQELASPIGAEANGVLAALVLLCNVAAAEDGALVAIDEPENALHPYAIRAFMRRAERWARQHRVTVLLSTHSPVILDQLESTPAQIYIQDDEYSEAGPVPLVEWRDREWLSNFRLGELYSDGELGSNNAALSA